MTNTARKDQYDQWDNRTTMTIKDQYDQYDKTKKLSIQPKKPIQPKINNIIKRDQYNQKGPVRP